MDNVTVGVAGICLGCKDIVFLLVPTVVSVMLVDELTRFACPCGECRTMVRVK